MTVSYRSLCHRQDRR